MVAPMAQQQVIRNVKRFAQAVRPYLPRCDVMLYGSYAHGQPRADSDIDVVVVVDEYHGDLLDLKARLFRLRRDIDVRIEPLLVERNHDPARFVREIERTGKVVATLR